MGDQGFDPCECVFGHDMMMRRLLSLLRQSQSYCTDTECYQDVVVRQDTSEQSFLVMSLMIAFALFMYYLQPRVQRNNFLEPTKARLNDNDTNGTPPPPPPPSSC